MFSPLSPLWDKAVRSSQVIQVQVDAFRGGVKVAPFLPIDPEGGMITADMGSDVWRTVSLTIMDRSLIPVGPDSLLTPHGTELHIHRGFTYPNGTTEMVPLGTFRIDKPSAGFDGGIEITGVDRSRLLAEDKFVSTAQSIDGATVVNEIKRLIRQSVPRSAVTDLTGSTTVCRPVIWEQDTSRWDAVKELAVAINAQVFVTADTFSTFLIKPVPDVSTPPVWTVDIGDTGVIIGGSESWDRENVYNAVTARSEPLDGSNPVQATVYDTTPGSPTNWHGPFGHRPRLYSSPLLTDVASCQAAARLILRRSVAPARTVTVSCVPNPALELGDVVTLRIPGLNQDGEPREENLMIHGFRMPIGLGAMELDLFSLDPGA
jgi:hypothetical protein